MKKLLSLIWPYTAQQNEPKKFIEMLVEYIQKHAIDSELRLPTIVKINSMFTNIQRFFMSKNYLALTASEIKPKHMEELRIYLHNTLESCSRSHASRHVELCKQALDYGNTMEYISYNPIKSVKTGRDRKHDIISLERAELNKLIAHEFSVDIYNKVKDLYLFQAFTGISYSDLYTYELNSEGWIESKRNKTGRTYYVPIYDFRFKVAMDIHLKYNGELPVISNQAYNRILKEISQILNISKNITTHTARKTFATLMADSGFNVHSISRMLGNTVQVAESDYIKTSRNVIESEITRLKAI